MEDFAPDLIIVDEMMPEMDGLAFSRNVRKNYQTATIPIIMLTAKDDMDTELQSIKAGVDVFMPKPFDIKKLQLWIAQLLQRKDSIEKSVRIEAVSRPAFIENHDHRSSDEIFMEKATKAIEENMGREDFDVSLLADMLSVENKQLYRKLKQLTGYSPVNYIRKLRMSKASILLKEDRFTVAEVMYLVGYSNSSYFSKCFSEEFGMTPKEFAINNRNKEKGQI
jgi:YesN/AraC family two-component response regulator